MRVVLAVGGILLAFFLLASATSAARGDAAKGKTIYDNLCQGCHGKDGKGDGPAAAALNPKPRDMTDKAYMSKLTDKFLFDITAKGGAALQKSPLMPGWESTLKEADVGDVVAYMRSLAK